MYQYPHFFLFFIKNKLPFKFCFCIQISNHFRIEILTHRSSTYWIVNQNSIAYASPLISSHLTLPESRSSSLTNFNRVYLFTRHILTFRYAFIPSTIPIELADPINTLIHLLIQTFLRPIYHLNSHPILAYALARTLHAITTTSISNFTCSLLRNTTTTLIAALLVLPAAIWAHARFQWFEARATLRIIGSLLLAL